MECLRALPGSCVSGPARARSFNCLLEADPGGRLFPALSAQGDSDLRARGPLPRFGEDEVDVICGSTNGSALDQIRWSLFARFQSIAQDPKNQTERPLAPRRRYLRGNS